MKQPQLNMATAKRLGIVAGWTMLVLFVGRFDIWLVENRFDVRAFGFPMGTDFTMYYAAARALWLNPHANLYALATLQHAYPGGCSAQPQYTYPYQPLLALLVEPFTALNCSTALIVWWQISFALWAVIIYWFASDAAKAYGAGRGLLVGALCVVYPPIWNGLEYGQIHVIMLFLFLLASRLAAKNQLRSAGAIMGLGVILKYVPAILVAYYLVRGRIRIVMWSALAGLALLISELLVVGPGLLLASVGGATSDVANYAHMRKDWMFLIPDGVMLARIAFAITFATILVSTWRKRTGVDALSEGWALCALLLVSPLPWYHYLTWLLPALVALLHATLDYAQGRGAAPKRSLLSPERLLRFLPLVILCGAMWVMDLLGSNEEVIGPVLVVVWGLCGVFYLASAGILQSVSRRLPAFSGRLAVRT